MQRGYSTWTQGNPSLEPILLDFPCSSWERSYSVGLASQDNLTVFEGKQCERIARVRRNGCGLNHLIIVEGRENGEGSN